MKPIFHRLNHVQIPIPPGEEAEAQAREFYGEILGLEEIEAPEVLREQGFFWYQLADTELHVGPETDFHVSRRHPAYEVANLTALKCYMISRKVTFSETSQLVDRERFFIYDPFGNRIELIEMNQK